MLQKVARNNPQSCLFMIISIWNMQNKVDFYIIFCKLDEGRRYIYDYSIYL